MKRYIVEIVTEHVTPVSIEADSEKEARELVISGEGDPGQVFFRDSWVLIVKCLGESI